MDERDAGAELNFRRRDLNELLASIVVTSARDRSEKPGTGSLEVRTGDRVYSALLPPDSEECLMREELSILGRDPVFERVLG